MANAKCRTYDQTASAGAYCSSCSTDIMAKALTPCYGGGRKRISQRQRRRRLSLPVNTRGRSFSQPPLFSPQGRW